VNYANWSFGGLAAVGRAGERLIMMPLAIVDAMTGAF